MSALFAIIMGFWVINGSDTLSVSLDTLPHDTVTLKFGKYMHLSGVRVKELIDTPSAIEMMAEDGYHIIAPIELIERNGLLFADSIDGKPLDVKKYGSVFVVPLDTAARYRMFAVKKLRWIKPVSWPFSKLPMKVYASNEQEWLDVLKQLPDSQIVMLIACDSMKLAFPAAFFKSYEFVHDSGTVGEFVDFKPHKLRGLLNISDPLWLIIDTSAAYALNYSPKLVFGDTVSVATLLKVIDYDVPERYRFRVGDRTFDFDELKSLHIASEAGKSYFEGDGVKSRELILIPHENGDKSP